MNIMDMKVDEILLINGLAEIAKEAKEASLVVSKAYEKAFGIKEEKIEVWHDREGYNFEYLTHDGVWQARYLSQTYDVECTPDGIFEYLKAEYLIKNGYASRTDGRHITVEGVKEEVVPYLRVFIKRAKELISSGQNDEANKLLSNKVIE